MTLPSIPHIQTQGLHDLNTTSPSTLCSSTSEPMLVTPTSSLSPNKRPKLSLQTTSVPVAVGRSSTALSVSLSALQSASPTIRNTFNNAYEIPHRPSPIQPTSASSKWPKPLISSITKREDRPYEMPLNVRSILKNAPYISSIRKSTWSATKSSSPRNSRRVFFPAVKKVSWRTNLEEEVTTVNFVARHSDLSIDDGVDNNRAHYQTSTFLSTPVNAKESQNDNAWTRMGTPTVSQRKGHRSRGESEGEDGEGQSSSGSTINTNRKRKPSEWRWTLGPFDDDAEDEEDSEDHKPPWIQPTLDSVSLGFGLTIDTAKISRLLENQGEDPTKTPFPFEILASNRDGTTMSPAS